MHDDARLQWTLSDEAKTHLRALDLAFARFLASMDAAASADWLLLAALLSRQLADGHLCMDLAQWMRAAEEQAWPPAWRDAIRRTSGQPAPAWLSDGTGHAPVVRDGTRLYLRRYWDHERTVARAIGLRLGTDTHSSAALEQTIGALFTDARAPDWSRVAAAIACQGAFTVITGGPGTGKTTTVVRLLAILQARQLASGTGPLRIRLAAPTGKAAARLTASIEGQLSTLPVDPSVRAAIPSQVETLHRLLGARPDTRAFAYHARRPLALDVLVIDEASMVDLEMMAAVLAALPDTARLILLGDKDQLSSVEAGAVLGDLCRRADAGHYTTTTARWIAATTGDDIQPWVSEDARPLDQHIVMLRHSHRFDADSGIGRLAHAVNTGDAGHAQSLLESQRAGLAWTDGACDLRTLRELVLGESGAGYRAYLDVIHRDRPPAGAAPDAFEAWAREALHAFGRFQLLCAVRHGEEGTGRINQRVEEILQREGLVDASHAWYEGRPVLVTRNDYALGLMNGDVGLTLRMPNDEGETVLRVVFLVSDPRRGRVDTIRCVLPSRLGALESVFAMTVHKSQGSEFDHTALILPGRRSAVATRELLYTGITRARSKFSLIAPAAMLGETIRQRVSRHSGLAERLAGDD